MTSFQSDGGDEGSQGSPVDTNRIRLNERPSFLPNRGRERQQHRSEPFMAPAMYLPCASFDQSSASVESLPFRS